MDVESRPTDKRIERKYIKNCSDGLISHRFELYGPHLQNRRFHYLGMQICFS